MVGRTHAIVGANAIWILPWLGILNWRVIPLLFIGILGGLLPDIDAKESELHHETHNVSKLLFINKLFGHRRFFHSFLAAAILYFLAKQFLPEFLPYWVEVLVVGYVGHELIDGFNTKGVLYFYPLEWPVNLVPEFLQSPCGGWADHAFFIAGAMGLGAFAYAYGAPIVASVMTLF